MIVICVICDGHWLVCHQRMFGSPVDKLRQCWDTWPQTLLGGAWSAVTQHWTESGHTTPLCCCSPPLWSRAGVSWGGAGTRRTLAPPGSPGWHWSWPPPLSPDLEQVTCCPTPHSPRCWSAWSPVLDHSYQSPPLTPAHSCRSTLVMVCQTQVWSYYSLHLPWPRTRDWSFQWETTKHHLYLASGLVFCWCQCFIIVNSELSKV